MNRDIANLEKEKTVTAAKFHRAQVGEMLKELYVATALKSLTLYGNPSVRNSFHQHLQPKGLRLL